MATGGSLAVVLTFVGPGFANGKTVSTLTIAGFALLVGLACAARPDHVPRWALTLLAPLGTVLVGLASVLSGTTTDGSELLYIWPILYTAYFMRLRNAFLNVCLVAAIYTPLSISLLGPKGITPSVYLVGTSVVTVLIVASLRKQLNELIAATELEARTDGLTGLANRRSWEEGVTRELSRQSRAGVPLCVLLIDLDHFKRLNDTHGHAAGDAALIGVACVLRDHARQSDVLARVGGEEFALLLPDCKLDEAHGRAEEIRKTIERTSARWPTPVTVSIGVAVLPLHGTTGDELVAAADTALYGAKRAGRNTVQLFERAS